MQTVSPDYTALRSRIFRFIKKSVFSDADAEDLTQVTLVYVWQACQDGRAKNPEAYAFMVARRRILNWNALTYGRNGTYARPYSLDVKNETGEDMEYDVHRLSDPDADPLRQLLERDLEAERQDAIHFYHVNKARQEAERQETAQRKVDAIKRRREMALTLMLRYPLQRQVIIREWVKGTASRKKIAAQQNVPLPLVNTTITTMLTDLRRATA